jgi:hypothetical protein
MAHFAKVHNGIVETVIVAEPEFFETFVDSTPGEWIQTSYNTRGGIHYQPDTNIPSEDQSKALRKNFATIGHLYDKVRDAFYGRQPFPSWTLNEDSCVWIPPVERPTGPGAYAWNEEEQIWEQIIG